MQIPFRLASLLAIALASGCVSHSISTSDRRAIVHMLQVQDEAWNRGDIDGFMEPYWQSPQLTFSGGGVVTRGWQETKARYKTRYPSREAMGSLSFDDLEIISISQRAALVLGRWKLERAKPISGLFSLVVRKLGRSWVIIHDHSSADDPK